MSIVRRIVTLAALLGAVACSADFDAGDQPTATSASAASAATVSVAPTAEVLASDPDFRALYRVAVQAAAGSLRLRRSMSPARQEKVLDGLSKGDATAIATAFQSMPDLDAQQHRLTAVIAARYVIPGDAAAARALFAEAARQVHAKLADPNGGPAADPDGNAPSSSSSSGGSSSGGSSSGGSSSGNGCENLCAVEFAAGSALAITDYIAALFACQLAGPFWPVCAAVASGAYGYQLWLLDRANDACIAKCD